MKRVVGGASALLALALAVAGSAAVVGGTVRVSVASGGKQANGSSPAASISGDGRFVVFASDASNLVRGDRNGVRDIFVRDLVTRMVQRVSVSSRGAEANGPSASSSLDLVAGPSISANGRLVAFGSDASNLVAGDTNGKEDCFVRDLKTHRTRRVSVSSSGAQGSGQCLQPAISANGRLVAFVSSSRLVPAATGGALEVFIHDLKTHRTRLVSVSSAGAMGNDASFLPSISSDGRHVAFESTASNLTTGDSSGTDDVFIRDVRKGLTQRLSHTSGGNLNLNSQQYEHADISDNGRYVTFASMATRLVAGDTNALEDVFVRGPVHPLLARPAMRAG